MVKWDAFEPADFEYDFERDKLSAHGVTFDEAVEVFFSDFVVHRNKRDRDRHQLLGRIFGGRALKIIFQLKPGGVVNHYRLASMRNGRQASSSSSGKISAPRTRRPRRLTESEIDERVVAEADEQSAWDAAIAVTRKPSAINLSADLARRAAFLARLHHERDLQTWIERVVRERVELEERAFTDARRQLGSKTGA